VFEVAEYAVSLRYELCPTKTPNWSNSMIGGMARLFFVDDRHQAPYGILVGGI
jgi:hypothetical protein